MAELGSPSSSSVLSPEALPGSRAIKHAAIRLDQSRHREFDTARGSTTLSGGTWTIAGGGDNVWGTADEFQFAYRVMSGDVDISARLSSFDTANDWSKAGLMIRDGLTANGRNAFVALSPGVGAALQRRTSTGGETTRTASGSGDAPGWVRLVRQGSSFTAYRSTDGRSWTTIATTTISMPATIYVGLAVASRDAAQLAAATSRTSRSVRHCRRRGGIATSEVRCGPAPQRPLRPGTFSVTGAGEAIWGNADQFQYVYQPIQGDTEIIARVASVAGDERRGQGGRDDPRIVEYRRAACLHVCDRLEWMELPVSGRHRRVEFRVSWLRRHGAWLGATRASGRSPHRLPIRPTASRGPLWEARRSICRLPFMSALPCRAASRPSRLLPRSATLPYRTARQASNAPPTVSLTSPATSATYTAPASMVVVAAASDQMARSPVSTSIKGRRFSSLTRRFLTRLPGTALAPVRTS